MGLAIPDADVCEACLNADGLCQRHARHVLPQLAQPAWVRLIDKARLELANHIESPSPAALKVMRRKARKAEKARFERQSRPTIAMAERRKAKRTIRLFCIRPKRVA